MDSKSIKLLDFYYDGKSDGLIHFWVGIGPQPSAKGHHVSVSFNFFCFGIHEAKNEIKLLKVPDELGYLEPLRPYYGEDVELQLPGDLTIFDIKWFSIYDRTNKRDLGHIIIPGKISQKMHYKYGRRVDDFKSCFFRCPKCSSSFGRHYQC